MRTQTVVISYCIWIYPPSQDASGRSWRVFWFGFPIPYPLSCLRSCVRDRVSCDRCRAFPLVEMEFRQCVCFPSENAFDKFDDSTDHPWQDAFSELGKNASGMRFLSLEKRIWAAPTLQEAFEMEKCPDAFFEPGKNASGQFPPFEKYLKWRNARMRVWAWNNASGMRFLSLEKRIWAVPTLQETFEMEKCPDAFLFQM